MNRSYEIKQLQTLVMKGERIREEDWCLYNSSLSLVDGEFEPLPDVANLCGPRDLQIAFSIESVERDLEKEIMPMLKERKWYDDGMIMGDIMHGGTVLDVHNRFRFNYPIPERRTLGELKRVISLGGINFLGTWDDIEDPSEHFVLAGGFYPKRNRFAIFDTSYRRVDFKRFGLLSVAAEDLEQAWVWTYGPRGFKRIGKYGIYPKGGWDVHPMVSMLPRNIR